MRATGNNLALELDIFLQHLFEREDARYTVYEREHNRTEGDLHLRVRKQLVENDLRVRVFLQIDNDPHTFAAGMVHDVTDTLNTLFIR